jgi:hypothetical protein
MQGKLIEDKMLETFMEELGCECSISWALGCRRGVSELNDGGYNSWDDQRHHIHSFKHAHLIIQNCQWRRWIVGERYFVWVKP